MSQNNVLTVSELAAHVGGRISGDETLLISRINSLEAAGQSEIAYVENEKFFPAAVKSSASCLLVPGKFLSVMNAGQDQPTRAFIEVARPKLAFALIAKLLYPSTHVEPGIHTTAVIASTADIALTAFVGAHTCIGEHTHIGAHTRIEAGVVIGANVTVGVECVLHPNVVLYDGITVGNRVILHAGVCVGADGFGYVRDNMGYQKFPQIGTAVIEDDVELGAYTCVDRAALGRTRIGRGTKIDNLVQVAHNVDIGKRVVIASQTGISGSTVIEDDAVIGGQVGFGDHVRVQSGATIGSKAGVLPGKIVRPGVWWGIPVQPLDEYKRRNAHISRVPQMREEIKELQHRFSQLEKRLDSEQED